MSVFGKSLEVSIFGASHEKYIGLTIHNFPHGIEIDRNLIKTRLKERRMMQTLTSKRFEDDEFEIVSGFFNGFSTGSPLTILISNKNQNSKDYEAIKSIARPSHADYSYYYKYGGFNDYRGGGVASGRMTVALIVLGALSEQLLAKFNIKVTSRVKQIKHIIDPDIKYTNEDILKLKEKNIPTFNNEIALEMEKLIEKTRNDNDSLGAIIETFVLNVPLGVGEPFFDSFESILTHLLFSIPGIKGVEFGAGFLFSNMLGSEANDQIAINNNHEFLTNNNGGINGGVTNGEIINFKTVFKPTSSIRKPQKTIDLEKNEEVELVIGGRHDTIIALKGLHVVNAVTYFAILELILRQTNEKIK